MIAYDSAFSALSLHQYESYIELEYKPLNSSLNDTKVLYVLHKNQQSNTTIITMASIEQKFAIWQWIMRLETNNFEKFVVLCLDNQLAEYLKSKGYSDRVVVAPSRWFSSGANAEFDVILRLVLLGQQFIYLSSKGILIATRDSQQPIARLMHDGGFCSQLFRNDALVQRIARVPFKFDSENQIFSDIRSLKKYLISTKNLKHIKSLKIMRMRSASC
jgi:hypothetical protein